MKNNAARFPMLMLLSLILISLGLSSCKSKPIVDAPEAAAEDSTDDEATETKVTALCLESDNMEWWEKMYCQLSTDSDSPTTKAYKKCRTTLKSQADLPKERCPRLLWLKTKTCDLWSFPTTKDHSECMQDEEFSKKVDENRGDYFGD